MGNAWILQQTKKFHQSGDGPAAGRLVPRQRSATYLGLKLNYGKCGDLTANQRVSSELFSDDGPAAGRLVPRQRSATYLDTLLTDTFDIEADMANRLGDCKGTAQSFWSLPEITRIRPFKPGGISF